MAFDKTPNSWIAGIEYVAANGTVPANSLVIPMTSLPELTSAELEGGNADIRKIYFAIADAFYKSWNTTDAADRPSKMTINRSTSVVDAVDTTTRNYTMSFSIVSGTVEVAPES
jgi:hypothetical protein